MLRGLCCRHVGRPIFDLRPMCCPPLFAARLVHPIVLLDDPCKTRQDLAALRTRLKTNYLKTKTCALAIGGWKYVSNLGIEFQRGLIGHGCKSDPDELSLFELGSCRVGSPLAGQTFVWNDHLRSSSGYVDKSTVAVVVDLIVRPAFAAAMPEYRIDLQ